MSLLIVGCGYVGKQVARAWMAANQKADRPAEDSPGKSSAASIQTPRWHVSALTRGGPDQLSALAQARVEPIVGDWLDSTGQWSVASARCALVSVPHRPDERLGERTHCVGLANLLARVPRLERLVVLSTTGVYHQSGGEWVDESSAAYPTRIGPQIALAAERWLAEHLPSGRSTVLRLAGIYGPGRIPLIAKLRAREPIPIANGDLNLIHVDDIAHAVVQLLAGPVPSDLYVLSDGRPVPRRRFYEDAARIFRTPPPVFVEPEPGSARAGRSESNKRVNPERILRELSLEMKYPDHIAGLTAIAAAEGATTTHTQE